MKNIFLKLFISFSIILVFNACAKNSDSSDVTVGAQNNINPAVETNNIMDELNPFDANISDQLFQMDSDYIDATGNSPFSTLFETKNVVNLFLTDCKRMNCPVYALVKKSEQKLYLYVNQQLQATWLVSTGLADGHETPLLDTHPNGRIYDSYTSIKYPGGDYKGLGNMPYAVFLYNGFAIHGTGEGNWRRLGRKASHGCVRVHPDNGFIFNRLVRKNGIYNVWFQITN
jgi:lipoprotein-anchoring transpeptidase ErfK/SrfK